MRPYCYEPFVASVKVGADDVWEAQESGEVSQALLSFHSGLENISHLASYLYDIDYNYYNYLATVTLFTSARTSLTVAVSVRRKLRVVF